MLRYWGYKGCTCQMGTSAVRDANGSLTCAPALPSHSNLTTTIVICVAAIGGVVALGVLLAFFAWTLKEQMAAYRALMAKKGGPPGLPVIVSSRIPEKELRS